jgi:acylphosphatase
MATEIHVRIVGRVQRVGFRWFVREHARRCDLAGWVRNNPDGSVEVHAVGDDECVERLRRAIAAGPDGARVDEIIHVDAGDDPPDLPHPFQMIR